MFYWRWFNRPRHPLARLLFGFVGALLLAAVLVFGFFALVAFAVIGTLVAVMRAFGRAAAPRQGATAEHNVIEGEFVVLPSHTASVKR